MCQSLKVAVLGVWFIFPNKGTARFYPFLTSEIVDHYHLDESISSFKSFF